MSPKQPPVRLMCGWMNGPKEETRHSDNNAVMSIDGNELPPSLHTQQDYLLA